MKYIETFREGDKIGDVYLCKSRTSLVTKNGKSYDSVLLQDKTGTVDAKIWDPNSQGIAEFDALDYVDIVAEVTVFNGITQLNVKRVRKVSEGEYDPKDYLPVSNKDIDSMFEELMVFIKAISNTYLKQLIEKFFVEDMDFISAFKNHSAAKTIHHGFIGGLLEHTLAVTKLSNFYSAQYPVLNKDLLITASILHDIGKIKELSAFPINDYTDDGQLLGHIIIGSEWIGDKIREIKDFPQMLAMELKHCILSHHGELEYGSPKKPALIEAIALCYADNTDAKIQTMTQILNSSMNSNDGSEWLGYSRLFESNIKKTSR